MIEGLRHATREASEFEKAMRQLQATLGSDAADLVQELARVTPWSLSMSKAVVEACFDRGMTIEQARDLCRAAVASPLPVSYWLRASDSQMGRDIISAVGILEGK